ncbi:heme ABC transporter permease, partial [Klebsiella aerogenes]
MIKQIFWRDLRLAFRNYAEIINPLWFFLIIITLFPLSIGPEPQLLRQIAPGIVWVAALLSSLLAMDRLFRDDWLDGSLQQLMLMPVPLSLVVLAKIAAHWVVSGLPLLIISPLIAMLFRTFRPRSGRCWTLTLFDGHANAELYLAPSVVGLTVGLRRGGVLLCLL